MTAAIDTHPPVKAVWMGPQTFQMMNAFGLIRKDRVLPFLHDGRYVAVHPMMPRTGIYDAPTPELAEMLTQAQTKIDGGMA